MSRPFGVSLDPAEFWTVVVFSPSPQVFDSYADTKVAEQVAEFRLRKYGGFAYARLLRTRILPDSTAVVSWD